MARQRTQNKDLNPHRQQQQTTRIMCRSGRRAEEPQPKATPVIGGEVAQGTASPQGTAQSGQLRGGPRGRGSWGRRPPRSRLRRIYQARPA